MEFLLLLDASDALNSRDILLLLNEYFSIVQVGKYEKNVKPMWLLCYFGKENEKNLHFILFS